MVRAIIAGNKTQTRRTVKRNASGRVEIAGKQWHIEDENATLASPYGQRGDWLWVKETWRTRREWDNFAPTALPMSADDLADPEWCAGQYITYATADEGSEKMHGKLRPSIFMMRWMSRITLEITAVRIQRLHEISEHDAEAEGCSHDFLHSDTCLNDNCALCGGVDDCEGVAVSAKENYRALWERINGKGSWDANPWVWVVAFKKVFNS